MHNNQKLSQSSLQSDKTYSNHSLRTNSNKYLHEEFDKADPREVECHFCHSKHIILEQLEILRQAVEAKNERIRELEGFIQKLSKMAFTTSTDTNQTNFAFDEKQQAYPQHQEDLTFAQMAPQQSQFKGIMSRDISKSSLNNFSRSNSSSIVSEISANEKENIKSSIKREIKKMTLDKVEVKPNQIQKSSPPVSRQSTLKNKLLEIINILPSQDSSANLQSFQTESEPFQEGHAGLVNAKVSNHKIVKHSGFLKKGETVSDDSMRSTLKSDTLKKIREATQQLV